MNIQPQRIKKLHHQTFSGDAVIYWSTREHRTVGNWSLLYAQKNALEYQVPLVVAVAFRPDLHKHNLTQRVFHFMLEGLQQIEQELSQKNIDFKFLIGDSIDEINRLLRKTKAGLVVVDQHPLTPFTSWQQQLADQKQVPVHQVDARNIVPVWEASDKQEYAARTIRPRIQNKTATFLTEYPSLREHPFGEPQSKLNWHQIKDTIKTIPSKHGIDWIKPGYEAAVKETSQFITQKLEDYNKYSNDPTKDVLSNLSPFLHFGHISAQEVALKVQQSSVSDSAKEVFLEQLIIRKELSDNYCYYNQNYKNTHGFPEWAQKSLKKHAQDKRQFIYDYDAFASASTHQSLWNAAQKEMLKTGKMHGYMRMYWAKKILEWSASPKEAQKIAIKLNDRYSLDGRDPNGYVGINWSIGGLHDQGWKERPIYGKVRYMNENGAQRKFDVDAYIRTWLD